MSSDFDGDVKALSSSRRFPDDAFGTPHCHALEDSNPGSMSGPRHGTLRFASMTASYACWQASPGQIVRGSSNSCSTGHVQRMRYPGSIPTTPVSAFFAAVPERAVAAQFTVRVDRSFLDLGRSRNYRIRRYVELSKFDCSSGMMSDLNALGDFPNLCLKRRLKWAASEKPHSKATCAIAFFVLSSCHRA